MKYTNEVVHRLSIVVPNLHSPVIGRTLKSLKSQICGQAEVEIIVVGMDKHDLVCPNNVVRFVKTPAPLCAAAARNLGIAHATGNVIAFIDADCVAANDWLGRLITCYESREVYAVAGGVDFPADQYWTLSDNLSTFYDYHVSAPAGAREYAPTLNLSVRRDVLDDVGLFDESFPGAAGEDIDLTLRIHLAGYPLLFEPTLVVHHLPVRNSFCQMLKRSFVFGRNMAKIFRRYRGQREMAVSYRYPLLLFVLAPLLGAGVTMKIFLSNVSLLRYWYTAPAVFLAKWSWRIGAAYEAYGYSRKSSDDANHTS